MSQGSLYERQTDNVLTGGINLLTPGDLKAATEASQCENWRVTSAGNLQSRFGNGGTLLSLAGANYINGLCQVKGTSIRRYATTAASSSLYRNNTHLGMFGGGHIGMCSYQGFLWAMSNTRQQRDDGVSLQQWNMAPPANPTLTPGIGGLLVIGLIYTYWVTYVSATQEEGPPNPAGVDTAPIADPNRAITVTSPGASPGAVFYNIYRIGNTLQAALKLNPTPILLGVDFRDSGDVSDDLDDVGVTRLGVALDPTAAGPPAGNGLAGPYYERLLAWGVAAFPNRLYYSATLQPYNFPGSQPGTLTGNYVNLGELGEAIVGVSIRPRMAAIYKDSSIWRLIGDPGDINSDVERVTTEVGLIGVQALCSKGSMDYFQANEGIYSFNGERVQKVTGKLDPLFRGESEDPGGFGYSSDIRLDPNLAAKQTNCLEVRNGRLYFFYAGFGASSPTRGVVCELGADNWATDSRPVTAIFDEGQNGFLMGAINTAGAISNLTPLEQNFQDFASDIPLAYQSGYKDQGHPDQMKMYADVVIEHNTGGAPLIVSAWYNNGIGPIPPQLSAITEALATISSTVKTTTTLQLNIAGDRLGVQARNISIGISGGNNNANVQIFKVLVHYQLEPRNSKTYDSDETDLGTQDVKKFLELELDINYQADGGGSVEWGIYTDRPAGTMARRDHNTFAVTGAGRQTIRIPFSVSPIEGRLVRVSLRCDTPGSTFQLYGVRLRILVYGEFYDGNIGEFYQTEAIGIGIG